MSDNKKKPNGNENQEKTPQKENINEVKDDIKKKDEAENSPPKKDDNKETQSQAKSSDKKSSSENENPSDKEVTPKDKSASSEDKATEPAKKESSKGEDKDTEPAKDSQTGESSSQEKDKESEDKAKEKENSEDSSNKQEDKPSKDTDKDDKENKADEDAQKQSDKEDLKLSEEEKKELEEKEKAKKEEKIKKAQKRKQNFKAFIKKNKLWIIIASIVLVLAIGATTTILVLNAPKVFIRNAEDFTAKDTSKKDLYVLKDDITVDDLNITDDMDIDLNKNTLTVNGTLNISLAGNEDETIDIGTIQGLFKNKGFASGGKLIANNIQIEANGRTFNLYSQTELSGEIIAKSVVVKDDMAIKEKLDLINTEIKFYAPATGNVALTNSNLYLAKDISLDHITADAFSNAEIYGNTLSVTGGNEISILQNATCEQASAIKELYFQQQTATIENAFNIDNLHIVNQLEKPAELIVETSGNTFNCVASEVLGAEEYIFTISTDDKVIATIPSASNEIDISEYLTKPTVYTISVKAASSQPKINLASEERTVEFSYSAKLENPSLSIEETEDDKIMLTFPAINFATVYKIDINGEKMSYESDDEDQINRDITSLVSQPGAYSIKVQATNPDNDSFTSSDVVMISYITTVKLDAPVLEINQAEGQVILSWEAVENTKYYVIENDKDQKIIMTKNTSYTFSADDVEDNTRFYIYSQQNGYYEKSDTSSALYSYQTLQKPQELQLSLVGDALTITAQPVENAQSYALFQNDNEIMTSANPDFEIENFQSGDTFKIEARADNFRASQSDSETYTA